MCPNLASGGTIRGLEKLEKLRDAFDPVLMAIGLVAGFAFVVDSTHGVKRDWILEPTWTLALYGSIPLASAVLMEQGRRLWIAIPTWLGLTILLAGIAARSWILDKGFFEERPKTMIVIVATGTALIVLAAIAGRVNVAKWGVGFGDWRWWLPRFAGLMALIVPAIGIAVALSPDLAAYYPEYKPARESAFILFEVQITTGIYMLGWEYFFRGYLTFGTAERVGAPAALLIQGLPFLLLHDRKPELEMVASYLGSVGLAAFCLRARTFLPAVFLHWGLNATMEVVGFIW